MACGEEGHRVVDPAGIERHVGHRLFQAAPAGVFGHQVIGDVRHALELHVEDVAEEVVRLGERLLRRGFVVGDFGEAQLVHVGGRVDHRVEMPRAARFRAGDVLRLQSPPGIVDDLVDHPGFLDDGVILEVLVVIEAAAQLPLDAPGDVVLAGQVFICEEFFPRSFGEDEDQRARGLEAVVQLPPCTPFRLDGQCSNVGHPAGQFS